MAAANPLQRLLQAPHYARNEGPIMAWRLKLISVNSIPVKRLTPFPAFKFGLCLFQVFP
jgi:hypothetical protein